MKHTDMDPTLSELIQTNAYKDFVNGEIDHYLANDTGLARLKKRAKHEQWMLKGTTALISSLAAASLGGIMATTNLMGMVATDLAVGIGTGIVATGVLAVTTKVFNTVVHKQKKAFDESRIKEYQSEVSAKITDNINATPSLLQKIKDRIMDPDSPASQKGLRAYQKEAIHAVISGRSNVIQLDRGKTSQDPVLPNNKKVM